MVKKDREWKKNKWKDRKRDKNGKWIYDYGDGFPDEKKNKIGTTYDLKQLSEEAKRNSVLNKALSFLNMYGDTQNRIKQISKGQRFLNNLSNLGQALTGSSLNRSIQAGRAFLNDIGVSARKFKSDISKFGDKVDTKTGLRLKKNKTSKDDDLVKANPSYGMSDGTGNSNCYACTIAYDLRKRGYDVTATEDNDGDVMSNIRKCYKNPKPVLVEPSPAQMTKENYTDKDGVYHNKALTNEVRDNLLKEPDGSSGYMAIKWTSGGGHAVAYEKENGKVMIYDAQTGQKVKLDKYLDVATDVAYFRTDNLEMNYNEAKKVVD